MSNTNKFKQLLQNKRVVIGGAAALVVVVIVIICLCINMFRSDNDKQPAPAASAKPTASAEPSSEPVTNDAAFVSSEAVSSEAVENVSAAPAASAAATDAAETTVPAPTASSAASTDSNTMKVSDETALKQTEFDQAMAEGDYSAAHDVLENYFKSSTYALKTLSTFNNYVSYYEAQNQYQESIAYQINYIETYDGLNNVQSASKHYQSLMESLKHIPDYNDSRLDLINASVTRWDELSTLMTNKDYDQVINKARHYIKDGPDCVVAYEFLSQAYDKNADYFEEAKVYYIFLSKDTASLSILESTYYFLFSEHINALYDTGKISDDQKNYLEQQLDLNYLKN